MFYCFSLAEAKVDITAGQGVQGGKLIELKKWTAFEKCPTVKTILVAKRILLIHRFLMSISMRFALKK